MKRLCSILIAVILLFTSISYPKTVNSQEIPHDPNQTYPIPTSEPREGALPESIPGDSAIYTYPIEGMELPDAPEPVETPEFNEYEKDAPLPSPELVEVIPSEELVEQPISAPPYSIDVEPAIYLEGKPIILSLTLSETEQALTSGKEVRLQLPYGLIPMDEKLLSQMSPDGTLTILLESFSGSIALNETLPKAEIGYELSFSVSILSNGEQIFTEFINVPTQGFSLSSAPSPETTGIPVQILSQDENTANNLLFYAGLLRSQSLPGYSLSLNPIEILAVDPLTGMNVKTFEQPLQVSLGYAEGEYTPEEEENLQAFYYNDLYNDWFPIETATDPDTNQVHFQTDHLTVFDIKVADWQSYIPPITQSYEVSGFTGATNFSYPLQTFAGPGGLKPDLVLSYNSQIIDQSIAFTQASWVGMGWTLETGSITRDMHGTDNNLDDDTFILSYNGISQRLLPISEANGVIQYRSQENPTEKVTWNTSTNIWEVRSGDGLIYTFGGIDAEAKLQKGKGCAKKEDNNEPVLDVTWRWGLSSVRDRFGNTITYSYIPEVKGISDTDDPNVDVYCYNHINLTPSSISYGSFKIEFVTMGRGDYRSSWQHENSRVLFTRNRLDHVNILVNNSIVKSYLLGYAADTETSNVIYPNFLWRENHLTTTLIYVQEVQSYGATPVEGYEPITFSYFDGEDEGSDDDYMHLLEVNNGYGGKIQFNYSAMYQDDDINKDIRTARWCFGSEGCPGNNPLLTTYCVSSNPGRGSWQGYLTEVACYPSDYEGNLMVYHNGFPSTAVHTFPEGMLKPGGRYIFYGKAKSIEYGTNTQFGVSTGVPVTAATDPISVPEGFMTTPASPWVYGQGDLVIPAKYKFDNVLIYLMNQGLLVKDLQIQQFITRYVVTQRVETDTLTGKSASWTYSYPTEFLMNTGVGNNPYIKTNYEYRGFSSVTITQHESERQDSLVTVQTFHQDDLLKGRLISEVTKDHTGLCYSQNLYTYETSTLFPYSQLIGLNTYTDLNISWIKPISVEKQSFDGAACGSLATSPHLGTQDVYTYPEASVYWSSLNGNPLSVKQRIFNGVAWSDEYATGNEYELSIDLSIGGITFFFSGDVKNTRVKACASESCSGALLAETLYSYNTNRTVSTQKVWTKGLENNRQYSQTNYGYHSNGNVASKTEWQGFATATSNPTGTSRTIQYTYDTLFPTQVTQETVTANGTTYTTLTSYDPRFGLPIQVTHPNGAVESAVYDGLGRTIRICAPGEASNYTACATGGSFTLNITYELNLTPPRITIARRSMASVRMEYTGFGKLQTRTIIAAEINGSSTDWVEKAYEYDGMGRTVQETNAGLSTRFLYDSIGRQSAIGRASFGNFQAEASYSYAIETLDSQKVWKTSIVDAKGNTSSSYANAKGQTIQTSPPTGSGPSVQFVYDLLGRLTQTTYGSAVSTISYNAAGLKTQMVDPDMGTWNYAYDAQGNLTSQTDARGKTTSLTYDPLNRLISKTFSDGSPVIGYTYDANGDLGYRTGMTDSTGSTAWDYDGRGRLITEEKTILGQPFTTNYTYDSADQFTSMTYPSGELVNITHLSQGGMNSVSSYQTGMQVNQNGQKSLLSFGNGTQTSYAYNDWLTDGSRLSQLQSGQSGSLLNLGFAYDLAGNITSITDNLNSSQIQTFSYDALNRLTSASTNATGQGQYSQTNGYNPTTGNLSSKSDVGAYTYSPAHPHAVTQAGSNTYAYDQNGNVTNRTVNGVAWTYIYNAENQLTSVRKNSQLVSEYGYDGDGKRVWAKDYEGYLATNPKASTYIGNYYEVQVEGYVQPTGGTPSQPCTQAYCAYFPFVANTVTETISYYHADGQRIAMRNNGVVSYLYGDQLGSVSAVAYASGNLVSRTLYKPWGTTRYSQGTNPTDYSYTGQMKEGDIYFYNARWYDPTIGRFMQADTIVPPTQGTQGFDRYAYVNNNPLIFIDPSGHWYIEGWDDTYILDQGNTNQCAVYSLAMAASSVSGLKVDETKLEQAWIWRALGLDWGIPPILQSGGVNEVLPGIKVEYMQGDKETIISFLEQGQPVVVTFAYPKWGHSVTAIGYEPLSDELIFANPAGGKILKEWDLVADIQDQIKYFFPATDLSQYKNFEALQSHNNFWIPSMSITIISRRAQGAVPSFVPSFTPRGGKPFLPVDMIW